MTGLDYSGTGPWLLDSGPDRDVVISSRVRLARNLEGFRFVNRADRAERQELVVQARQRLSKIPGDRDMVWIDLLDAGDLERLLLVERHLISKQLAKGKEPRAVAVSRDESLAIMINEEDHYRMQVIRSGFQLRSAYQGVNEVDDLLGAEIGFAFHERFGYLTACPTNVGTGIRISVMLHLPALTLTNEIERVRRAARDMQLAVRGFYGEGSEALGDLYQLSNQTTLGKSEDELLDEFETKVIPQVIAYERKARQLLIDKRTSLLEDRCYRAYGLLVNARLIKADEAMRLLSHLRLGIETERIDDVETATVNRLLLQCQPGHLQKSIGRRIPQARRSEARARLIRETLGGKTG